MNKDSKEFKALQAKWDKKLKASGFEDIEQRKDGNLKKWSCNFAGHYKTELTVEAKTIYYQQAGRFLHEHKFKNKTEKRIWELHNDGVSIRNIVKTLTREGLWFVPGGKPHKLRVHEELQAMTKQMIQKVKGLE